MISQRLELHAALRACDHLAIGLLARSPLWTKGRKAFGRAAWRGHLPCSSCFFLPPSSCYLLLLLHPSSFRVLRCLGFWVWWLGWVIGAQKVCHESFNLNLINCLMTWSLLWSLNVDFWPKLVMSHRCGEVAGPGMSCRFGLKPRVSPQILLALLSW